MLVSIWFFLFKANLMKNLNLIAFLRSFFNNLGLSEEFETTSLMFMSRRSFILFLVTSGEFVSSFWFLVGWLFSLPLLLISMYFPCSLGDVLYVDSLIAFCKKREKHLEFELKLFWVRWVIQSPFGKFSFFHEHFPSISTLEQILA